MVTYDRYMAFSDDELWARIRELTEALTGPDQSGSSKDVGSYTNKSPAEMRAELASMQRCWAIRKGLPVPRVGMRFRKVYVTKDYY